MQDIIQLLPDTIANQIAAGEVIQRPASVVKELLENSIDAKAEKIVLKIKEAGRQLIMVTDNGTGMSETDARMSFERHATSKLKSSDDLFNIKTKGFRGEALASIAAVSQVEMKTKRNFDVIGTKIEIAGGKVLEQEPSAMEQGTTISVKNLFYNIPARRNFLKSNQVETSHITDEFYRVALAHPDITFHYINNDAEFLRLEKGNLKQRIVALFGNTYNEKLIPLSEETTIATVSGFIVKPDACKKTRGEQYFFVNNRFIRSTYLHHAVQSGYESLIPKEQHAGYFIFINIDPAHIDINIHPTKTEIKFFDEKSLYSILRSSVKRSLGIYNITPSINFDLEQHIEIPLPDKNTVPSPPTLRLNNPHFNPFTTKDSERNSVVQKSMLDLRQFNNKAYWEVIYEQDSDNEKSELTSPEKKYFQFLQQYLITKTKKNLILIDQQLAHEKVLYEKFILQLKTNRGISQKLMFPVNVELPFKLSEKLKEILDAIKFLGFDIEFFGNNSWVVSGIPPNMKESSINPVIEKLLADFIDSLQLPELETNHVLALSMARNLGLKNGKLLTEDEINQLINELFACENPQYSANGNPIFITLASADLEKLFKK